MMRLKTIIAICICCITAKKPAAQPDYSSYPVYQGTDLGLTYTAAASSFRIWSPPAEAAELLLYREGIGGEPVKTIALTKDVNGTWIARENGDLKGSFYAFRVRINGKWSAEVPDPYAKAAGVNGRRAMVIDLKSTNPPGWEQDKSPAFSTTNAATDAIIYELHVRDASIHASSGIVHKGLFTGLAEAGTRNASGQLTGVSHIKELGVTHVHLLPFFDYNSVDESRPNTGQYNWGYDPLNYNIPEGSYSSNPYEGAVRINELKQLVAAFHRNGLRVVMDVVYNHVADAASSNFQQLVPGYYFRHKPDGTLSDATACGNETASEMPMMRKFMIESLLHWVQEYHIDGFRFDLMGVHDIETMNQVSAALHAIKPDILLYGEGWTAGGSPLPDSLRALKKNAWKLHNIAVFSDDIRDGIKGSVFDINDRGFVSGKPGMEESVKFGITAAGNHPQVNLDSVNYSRQPYTAAPWNVITYCECHDNNTLWDKLSLSCPTAATDAITYMHQQALIIVLTSQGIPFLHAGTEFLRNKKGVENSYNAGDSINAIDWSMKQANKSTVDLVQQLISLRKTHPAFRLTTTDAVNRNIRFSTTTPAGTIAYTIDGAAVNDPWGKIFLAFNGSNGTVTITLPEGKWKKAVAIQAGGNTFKGKCTLPAHGAIVLYQE